MANLREHRMEHCKAVYVKNRNKSNFKEKKHWIKKQEVKGFLEDKKFEKKIKMMMKAGK